MIKTSKEYNRLKTHRRFTEIIDVLKTLNFRYSFLILRCVADLELKQCKNI